MKRILIVDDVAGWIRFHKSCIEKLNIPDIQIDCAYCAKEALAKLEVSIDAPYDIILTDMQMESDFLPKFAGEWLIEQIQNFGNYYKNTKIIIVSAAPNIKEIAQHYGVSYLPKVSAKNFGAEVYKELIK